MQIRLQWDQGSLLKQIEVIGKSGRNWPIRDSREQISFIQSCLKSAGTGTVTPPSHNELVSRNRNNSNNALRDPHASLKLFGPRDELEDDAPARVVSPYAGSRPHQRSFTDILGDEPADPDSPSANHFRSMSPSKGGQGKNFHPPRLFNESEEPQQVEDFDAPKEKRYIRPNPTKYSHFDFADGSDPQDAPQPGFGIDEHPKTKRDSQWSFGDFVTPQKPKPSKTLRHQDVRHWDTDRDAIEATPGQPPVKPRRDAEPHFELQDDGERVPQPDRPGAKPRGYTHNEGLGLYKNQLFDREESTTSERALGNITNIKDRNKDFDPHFDINDNSPAQPEKTQHVPEARKKAVKMMDANWSSYEQSPTAQKENRPAGDAQPVDNNRIHIAGDGMGGRKGTNRDWLYGETEPQTAPQSVPGRRQQGPPASGRPAFTEEEQKQKQRINIAGDGMGGRKGTDRDWLYGETEPQNAPQTVPGRTPHAAPARDGPAVTEEEQKQKQRINIAGDGMGGRKGTNRDWLYGETEPQDAPHAVPGRTPHAAPTRDGPAVTEEEQKQKQRINIAGDGMGGRKGTNRDWLYGETEPEAAPQAIPGRTPHAAPARDGPAVTEAEQKQKQRIHIAGDGMGGRKGTNRDWLYGEVDDTPVNPNPKPVATKPAAEKGFWDF